MGAIVVIRHGRAQGNAHHRFIGQSDVPLEPEGHHQARLVAQRLATATVARILSSDLRRARDTAAPLATLLGLPVETDRRLREVDNGDWTGHLPDEIATAWPETWRDYVSGHDVQRPGGESWNDVRLRVRAVLEELQPQPEETLVVVTHGGPALLAVEWAMGTRLPGNIFTGPLAGAANSSVTVIDPAGPRLVAFNDVGHLDGVTLPPAGLSYLPPV